MNHSFDPRVAKEFGVNEAIIIQHLQFWIIKNVANKVNFKNGKYWTYNSYSAFQKIFFYLSESQIKRILKKLYDKNVIEKSNFNKLKMDQTNWYTFKEGYYKRFILDEIDNEDSDGTESSDRNTNNKLPSDEIVQSSDEIVSYRADEIVRPIPYIITDINTDDEEDSSSQFKNLNAFEELIELGRQQTRQALQLEPVRITPQWQARIRQALVKAARKIIP